VHIPQSELIRLKQELAQFEAEPKRRAARKIELAKVLDAGRDRLATLDKELAASPATDETPPLAMAPSPAPTWPPRWRATASRSRFSATSLPTPM
jgi:hypothetical protein